jgi:hypothetical protein
MERWVGSNQVYLSHQWGQEEYNRVHSRFVKRWLKSSCQIQLVKSIGLNNEQNKQVSVLASLQQVEICLLLLMTLSVCLILIIIYIRMIFCLSVSYLVCSQHVSWWSRQSAGSTWWYLFKCNSPGLKAISYCPWEVSEVDIALSQAGDKLLLT